jgi:hypothetical protein
MQGQFCRQHWAERKMATFPVRATWRKRAKIGDKKKNPKAGGASPTPTRTRPDQEWAQ